MLDLLTLKGIHPNYLALQIAVVPEKLRKQAKGFQDFKYHTAVLVLLDNGTVWVIDLSLSNEPLDPYDWLCKQTEKPPSREEVADMGRLEDSIECEQDFQFKNVDLKNQCLLFATSKDLRVEEFDERGSFVFSPYSEEEQLYKEEEEINKNLRKLAIHRNTVEHEWFEKFFKKALF